MPNTAPAPIDPQALFKLSYGLFVLTARAGGRDNGCILNTAMQVTESPRRMAIAVNKANYTHELVLESGVFNLNVLTTEVPFFVFQHFGFQSGRTLDKFAGCEEEHRTANGVLYVPKFTNAVLSGAVRSTQDLGTHTLFIADVTEARVLSDVPSITYAHYFAHTKPRPAPAAGAQRGYACKVCGYVYEGDVLPVDFVCPLCKHSAADFEPLPADTETERSQSMKKYVCQLCGYVYDEAAEGVKWDELPADWTCPLCGAGEDDFSEE